MDHCAQPWQSQGGALEAPSVNTGEGSVDVICQVILASVRTVLASQRQLEKQLAGIGLSQHDLEARMAEVREELARLQAPQAQPTQEGTKRLQSPGAGPMPITPPPGTCPQNRPRRKVAAAGQTPADGPGQPQQLRTVQQAPPGAERKPVAPKRMQCCAQLPLMTSDDVSSVNSDANPRSESTASPNRRGSKERPVGSNCPLPQLRLEPHAEEDQPPWWEASGAGQPRKPAARDPSAAGPMPHQGPRAAVSGPTPAAGAPATVAAEEATAGPSNADHGIGPASAAGAPRPASAGRQSAVAGEAAAGTFGAGRPSSTGPGKPRGRPSEPPGEHHRSCRLQPLQFASEVKTDSTAMAMQQAGFLLSHQGGVVLAGQQCRLQSENYRSEPTPENTERSVLPYLNAAMLKMLTQRERTSTR